MCREYNASLFFLLETYSSGERAKRQASKMGLSDWLIIDSIGQSGGLWCLWDVNVWKVQVIESTDQFAHLLVTWKGTESWFMTAVYANPRHARKQMRWEDLARIAAIIEDAWVVLGDFNSITGAHERKGGAMNFTTRGMWSFCDMIQNCNLLDAGFQGSPFTWKNGRLQQHLDRVLINMLWRMKFQGASVFHLPFFKSDHRAILLQLKSKRKPNKRRRPFRFLAAWLTHKDFPNLMGNSWPRNSPWCVQVKHGQITLCAWN